MSRRANRNPLFFVICILSFLILLECPSFAVHKLPKDVVSRMVESLLSGHKFESAEGSGDKHQSKHPSAPPLGKTNLRNFEKRLSSPFSKKPLSQHLKQRLSSPQLNHFDGDLNALFNRYVPAVPLVISGKGWGSSAVVEINKNRTVAKLITSAHILKRRFKNRDRTSFVRVLFHDRLFKAKPKRKLIVDIAKQISLCNQELVKARRVWCDVYHTKLLPADIVKIYPDRDLALLRVSKPPKDVRPFTAANASFSGPGKRIVVIGHGGLIPWSFTVGHITGVCQECPMGSKDGTIILHQAPILPGHSGGPLLTLQGLLLGINTWKFKESQGFNGAIAVNEFQSFLPPQTD